MSNILIGWPIYSDTSALYTPGLSASRSWPSTGSLALTNLKDRRLHRAARSISAALSDTRFRCDLGTDRSVRVVALPRGTWSTSAKWRVLGVPSTQLFNYEAGDDIPATSGTHARAPTATVRAATYVDSAGRIQYAGENRCLRSEAFDNASWTKSSVTVTADSVAAPDGTTTADTLTASGSNGTVLQSVTETAVSWTFSVWLKRKTGTGNIQIQVDGATWVTQTLTTEWQRFSVTQTGGAGATSLGIRIATNGDAVYAWGAQAEIGTTATSYLPTTSASVSAPRDAHYPVIGGARTYLHEGLARTNLVLQSSNLGTTWSAISAPDRTAAAATCGVVSLDLIADNDLASACGYSQTVTFTGDAVKAISFLIRQGSSTSSVVQLVDTSAGGVYRLRAAITWSGGLPVITMTNGTSLGYRSLVDASGNAVFQVYLLTTSVTAANTNSLRFYPATDAAEAVSNSGDAYFGGVQAENALFPSSHIPTTTGTVQRFAETLQWSYSALPQNATAYVDLYFYGAVDGGTNYTTCEVGDATAAAPYWLTRVEGSALAACQVQHNNGSATVSSNTGTAAFGNRLEQRNDLQATGNVRAGVSIDSAADTTGTNSGSNTLAAAWSTPTKITVGARGDGSQPAFMALRSVRITASSNTMATMRAVVSDSGWLDMWPSGLDAEESLGMNVPAALILSTAFSARYWSVQISDAANSAGYVDVNRLVVAGAFQPTVNVAWGAELGVDTLTVRDRARSGVAFYDEQPRFRRSTFVFDNGLTETEAMTGALDFLRIAGIHQQFFFMWDPTDTTHIHRRAFLACLEKTPMLRCHHVDQWGATYDVVEEI